MKQIIKKLALTFFVLIITSGLALAEALNINAATADEIAEALTGIGKAKAEAIVKDREENGKFESVEDLSRVSGIGPATVEKNRDIIAVN